MNAFIHVGSRETLNRMRNFVLHMTFYPAQRRVTDALEQAIPLMEARLKRQEVPETLLRAAAIAPLANGNPAARRKCRYFGAAGTTAQGRYAG